MEYSIIDSQMANPNKDKLVEIAKLKGYKFYSEMLYDMHCNQRKSPREISDFMYDDDGNRIATKEGIYYTLNKYGWLIKKIKYSKPEDAPKQNQPICVCCGRAPKHKDLHRLCMTCYKSNGHNTKGAQGGNFDPNSEYSHSGILISWGQA